MLENIRKMREKRDAPVDTMGCQKCYEGQDFISSILKKNLEYEISSILICILSDNKFIGTLFCKNP